MNTVIVLITLMIALAMAATPLRPEVSETFEANINIEFVNSTISASGQGILFSLLSFLSSSFHNTLLSL